VKNKFRNKVFVYLLLKSWYDGSSYKDYWYLKQKYGGIVVRNELSKALNKGIKPDMVFCLGDAHPSYKQPLEAGIPYCLQEQDVYSLRFGLNDKNYAEDREKIENACSVLFTSRDHAEYYEHMKKKHGWRLPYYEVIHTRNLKEDLIFSPKVKLDGLNLVYAGGVRAKWNENTKYNTVTDYHHYKAFHHTFKKFIEAGWKVHIYPTKLARSKFQHYQSMGCIIHDWIPGNKILREISQYTAGLHSYNRVNTPKISFDYTQKCRGNKIYDYLAAGIPTIGYDGGNGMKIYDKKWGIIIKDLEKKTLKELPGKLANLNITDKMRFENAVIEKDADKFEKLIEVALEVAKEKKKIKNIVYNPYIPKRDGIFTKVIIETNKSPRKIIRANKIFEPYETTGEITVNMREWKEIKAHVGLRIKHLD
jgi:hypothetical protein